MRNEQPRRMPGQEVDIWEMESEAWERDVGRKLRILHYERAMRRRRGSTSGRRCA